MNPSSSPSQDRPLTLPEIQQRIAVMFGEKDTKRGPEGTFLWLSEEVGELAAALREQDDEALALEFADVLAWLVTLANIKNVDLNAAFWKKYGRGCPGCKSDPCLCGNTKP